MTDDEVLATVKQFVYKRLGYLVEATEDAWYNQDKDMIVMYLLLHILEKLEAQQ